MSVTVGSAAIGAGIMAGSNAIGSLISGGYGNYQQQQEQAYDWSKFLASNEAEGYRQLVAQDFSASEAQKQRDWNAEMSNTAYQRQVEDMKKAGLNPSMMYAGAGSTPGGVQSPSSAGKSAKTSLKEIKSKAALVALAEGLASKYTNSAKKAANAGRSVTKAIRLAQLSELR